MQKIPLYFTIANIDTQNHDTEHNGGFIMIAIASDHGGFALKEHLKNYLTKKGIECKDFGTYSTDSCDYPIFGRAAAEAVSKGECDRGIVICTTGIGISISANKVKGIR